ncbi:MAG: WG repeat-containing protein [Lachnospiraceae bacterium]|nr:WG repeat-containing protein [Lachnospiraceae bacterium]
MKYVIAVVMTLLSVFVWFSLLTGPDRTKQEYQKAMESARDYEERQIYRKALDYYEEAGKYADKKQKYSIGMKIVEMSVELNDAASYEKECKNLIKNYPSKKKPYEQLLKYYQAKEDIKELVPFLKKTKKRFPKEEIFHKAYRKLEEDYTQSGESYDEISDWLRGYALVKTSGNQTEQQNFLTPEKEETDYRTGKIFQVLDSQTTVEADGINGERIVMSDHPGELLLRQDKKKQWSMIDGDGNITENNPDAGIEEAGPYIDHYAAAKIKGKYYWINQTMRTSKRSFDMLGSFWEGTAPVCQDGKWALFSAEKFQEITKYCFSDIKRDEFGRGMVADRMFATKDSGYQMYNRDGKRMGAESFEDAKPFVSEEPAAVKQSDRWGFADRNGKLVIDGKYEEAGSFAYGYAAVKQDGKWGVINEQDEMVIKPCYQMIKSFNSEGYAAVQTDDGKWSFIRMNTIAYR